MTEKNINPDNLFRDFVTPHHPTVDQLPSKGAGVDLEKDTEDKDATITNDEAALLNQNKTTDEDLVDAELDTVDEDGEPLNEDSDFTGADMDIPGADMDDDDELIGEEDDENNGYSEATDEDEEEEENKI